MIHTIMAQIVDILQTKSTVGFADALANRFESKYGIELTRLSTATNISNNKPVLVMCQTHSRIATDILNATNGVGGIPDNLVAVVIIHVKALHSLPTLKSSDVVADSNCRKYGLLVDFGYLDGRLHDCELNAKGENELLCFLDEHTSKAVSKEQAVGTATKPNRNASTRKGADKVQATHDVVHNTTASTLNASGPVKCGIQFFSELEYGPLFENMLKKFVDVKTERSLTDLRKGHMWIVVCHAESDYVHHVREGDSQNAKILVLIDPRIKDSKEVLKTNDKMLEIKLQKTSLLDDRHLLGTLQSDVVEFTQAFIDNDVSKIFDKDNTCIEAYTNVKMIQTKFHEYLGITPRVVQSLADFTDQDSGILWIMVCENTATFEKEFKNASSTNAKMILLLDESIHGDTLQFEQQESLMVVRLRRSLLPLDAAKSRQMKNKIKKLMKHVQTRLLKVPLEKLFLELKNGKSNCNIV